MLNGFAVLGGMDFSGLELIVFCITGIAVLFLAAQKTAVFTLSELLLMPVLLPAFDVLPPLASGVEDESELPQAVNIEAARQRLNEPASTFLRFAIRIFLLKIALVYLICSAAFLRKINALN